MDTSASTPKKGYGIIGAGAFGAEYARILTHMPGCDLVAVYSPGQGAKRVAAETGCEAVARLEELLSNPRIDGVLVVSPNYLHCAHVVAAAQAGKAVYCEKPAALTVADTKAMVTACRDAGVHLMLGHIMHYYSGIVELKRRIDAGALGTIINAHVERTGWERKQEQVSWKKVQDKSGGHLFHHIHEIDIVQWIMGTPRSVYCAGGNYGHTGPEYGDEDDLLLVTALFERGIATFQYGSGFRMGNHFIRVNGTEAGALVSFPQASVTIRGDGGQVEEIPLFASEKGAADIRALFAGTDGGIHYARPSDRPPAYILESMEEETALFHHVVCGGQIPPDKRDLFDGTSAMRSVMIAENALRSKQEGRPIVLEGPGEERAANDPL